VVSALGIALALRITSMEGFHVITSFIMMPAIFLSGAFYPVDAMPEWMKALAYADPLTYGVDLARHYLVGVADFSPLLDYGVLAASAVAALVVAAMLFRRATIE